MDADDTTPRQARPLIPSFSETSIASQLLEDRDEEMSPPATDTQETDVEEALDSEILGEERKAEVSKGPNSRENSEMQSNEAIGASLTGMDVDYPNPQSQSLSSVTSDLLLKGDTTAVSAPHGGLILASLNEVDASSAVPTSPAESATTPSVSRTAESATCHEVSEEAKDVHTALPPNYPPVIYPEVLVKTEQVAQLHSPGVASHTVLDLTETTGDGDGEQDSGFEGMDIDEDNEDARSELSEGVDLRVSRIHESGTIS